MDEDKLKEKRRKNAEYQREWRRKNKERSNEIQALSQKKRYDNDPEYREKKKLWSKLSFKKKMEIDSEYNAKMKETWRNYSANYYEVNKEVEQIRKKGRHYIKRCCQVINEDDSEEIIKQKMEDILTCCKCEITCEYVIDEMRGV